MVVISFALRDAVSVGVCLLLLLLLRNAEDSVDAVRTGSLGVMVAPGVMLRRLYRGRWCMCDNGHRAGLLLLLLLRCAARGLLLLLVMNMLRLLRSLVPNDPATHRQDDNIGCSERRLIGRLTRVIKTQNRAQ
jgi:hypothetical protein